MKISTELDKNIQNALASEHLRALNKVIKNKDFATVIPMHTAKMKITNPTIGETSIKDVIIPELAIYTDKSSITEDKKINRGVIDYRIANNGEPFPLAHVYRSSGHLCLGNIFVPNLISIYNPQQPLETLFLHNDRNENHGRPVIKVSVAMRKAIFQLLQSEIPSFTNEKNENKLPFDIETPNWVQFDTLWNISAWLLERTSKQSAFTIMEEIFLILYPKTSI